MLHPVLNAELEALLGRERQLLGDLRALLARVETPAEAQAALRGSIAQLDEMFLLVVVGEFNAGKSAVLNALLGGDLLAEGVTPTTGEICLLRYGEAAGRSRRADGIAVATARVELLRHINLVDTPGTNAIERHHEALTEEFVPRADLVLFVTSADRPFTESERSFLERLRDWGKKVVVAINKVDILESAAEVETVRAFVAENANKLLGLQPQIFAVSARRARRGKAARRARPEKAADGEGDPGFAALESYIHATLDEVERLRLKLLNPLGVARRVGREQRQTLERRSDLLEEDVRTLADIDRQHTLYREDMEREFRYRLGSVEKLLHELENRGVAYFDDTLRLVRIADLMNASRVKAEFERQVVAETPNEIQDQVSDIIDWMVTSEHRQWQGISELVHRRRDEHGDRIVGEVTGNFESSRAELLDSLGRRAKRAVESYDRRGEAARLAESLQKAVAGTALLEVGAVGLGAAVALVATTTAVDVTGILAAGTLATLGLFVIPARRRRAKRSLRQRLSELREQLMAGLSDEFSAEIERSVRRIEEATGPYTRFVRAERERLGEERAELDRLAEAMAGLESEIEQRLGALEQV